MKTKIMTWNIRGKRRDISTLLSPILKNEPDILCLQEVSKHGLQYLQSLKDYSTSYVTDTETPDHNGDIYVCILSIKRPNKTGSIIYHSSNPPSLLNMLIYKYLNNSTEQHKAIWIDISDKKKPLRIVSTRISCAIGAKARIASLRTLLEAIDYRSHTILCGDLNIVDSKSFNILTGWMRGFSLEDYSIDERNLSQKLFDTHGLINIFKNVSTSIFPWPILQFDHILIPKNFAVFSLRMWKPLYGSDHHILEATVTH